MPAIWFDVHRAGLAEEFVRNLEGTLEQKLNQALEGIATDIARNAPRGGGKYNKKEGDIPLSESFGTEPVRRIEPSVLEGYITSSVPAKARAHEYGSGVWGQKSSRYEIHPRNAKKLAFRKEGKLLVLPFVKHPGVFGKFYIAETLRVWLPALREHIAEAIRLAAVPYKP